MNKHFQHLIFAIGIILVVTTLTAFLRPRNNNQPPQEKKLTLVLSIPETETILKGLESLPYRESAGIIANIMGQAQKQIGAKNLPDSTKNRK